MKLIYDFFNKTTMEYLESKNKDYRKEFSQFFTTNKIAKIMISNLEVDATKNKIRILEPSAGTGILILNLIDEILKKNNSLKIIEIEAVEIDYELFEILKVNLEFLKMNFKTEIEIKFDIKNRNFILEYGIFWNNNNLLFNSKNIKKFDFIISNPPYKKIKKSSIENLYFKDFIVGQPNIYHLFIALSLTLLETNGQYFLISPKNFLGGKYTEKLRNFIFKNFSLTYLHLFKERNKLFGGEVLQEICITNFIKNNAKTIKINNNEDINNYFYTELNKIQLKNSNALLFPEKIEDIYFKEQIAKNGKTLKEQGLKYNVGKVVLFRIDSENKLSTPFLWGKKEVPLLITRHIFRNNIKYTSMMGNKEKQKIITLKLNVRTKSKLIDNKNYVIFRKNVDFMSEQFIQASVYDSKLFKTDFIGIDNNLGYISKINGDLDLLEAQKISNFLNSKIFEKYYKLINNSHTINSYELENMIFPIF